MPPVIKEQDVLILVDVHEERAGAAIIEQLPYNDRKFPFCAVTADVADIIICVRYTLEQMREMIEETRHYRAESELFEEIRRARDSEACPNEKDNEQLVAQFRNLLSTKDAQTAKRARIDDNGRGKNAFNPVVDYCKISEAVNALLGNNVVQQFEPNKYIYVPLVAIERKEAKDMASSIGGGNGKDPGFSRYKDQKMRMKQFRELTGCDLMFIIEEYYKHCQRPKVGHLDQRRFDSALLSTAFVDRIPVHHTTNFLHTVYTVTDICHRAVKHSMCNVLFPQIYNAVERALESGAITAKESDAKQYEKQALKVASEVRSTHQLLYDTVPTQKISADHSQIVSIRKKDNHNPAIRMQMQLSAIPGISEKLSKAIQCHYPSMSSLIQAYEELPSEQQRCLLLRDIEKGSYSKSGKPLTVGKSASEKVYKALYNV